MIWSGKYLISEYIVAPKKDGIYILGTPNGFYYKPGQERDVFLGENFPEDFEPMYVGISKRSIRSRLYSHFKGLGNKKARDHINENGSDNVFYIFCESPKTEIEDIFLISLVNGFSWNVRKRELGNFIRLVAQI
jgi:hypothetical protein